MALPKNGKIIEDNDELEIRICLLESCAVKRRKAVGDAFKKWRYHVASYIHKKFPIFNDLQLKDVVSQTFLELLTIIENGDFDPDRPIYPLLLTIAHRRGVDEYRKKRRFVTKTDDYIEEVYNRLHETEIGETWKQVISKISADEIQEEFRIYLGILPPGQRIIAKIMFENFPNELTYGEISEKVLNETGETLSSIQIKGRQEALRKKFREILKRKTS